MAHTNAQTIKDAVAAGDVAQAYERAGYAYELKPQAGGKRYLGLCEFHADKNPSFTIWSDGGFRCFACGASGSIIDFIALKREIKLPEGFGEACQVAAEVLGIAVDDTPSPRAPTGKPIAKWSVIGDAGEVIAEHHKFEGKPKFRWYRGGTYGLDGLKPETFPLYASWRLKDIPDGTPIIVCEGEKAADACWASGWPAVSGYGANVYPDAGPLAALARFLPVIWPDNDTPGQTFAQTIAERLGEIGVEALRLDVASYWPSVPEKADAYDFLERYSAQALADLVGNAQPVKTSARRRPFGGRTMIGGAELLAADLPDPTWLVEGLLPEGLTILAGRPKIGKSWLALQVAHAICCGGQALERTAVQGRVLYVALEDSPKRIQKRMREQSWTAAEAENLTVCMAADFDALRLHLGTGEFDMAVVDTIGRLMIGLGKDQNDNGDLTEIFAGLQALALDTDTSVVVVEHHTKHRTADVIDDVAGATAKAACADTIMGLYRERGQQEANFRIVGRDVEEQEIAVAFDAYTMTWVPTGGEQAGANRKHAVAVMDACRGATWMTAAQVAAAANINKMAAGRTLKDLAEAGVVEVLQQGKNLLYRTGVAERESL